MLQLGHPPRNREELWWAVYALFDVAIPRTQVCPDHCSPFDAFADAYFRTCSVLDGRYLAEDEQFPISRVIWHASRGLAGKSKTLSVLGLTLGYLEGADITVLGGSMAQSANVHEYMTKGMESDQLPRDMTLDQTMSKILLANLGRMRPIAASQKTARGPHPSALLMDEVDEMELDIYDAALGQPMPQKNYLHKMVKTITVLSSTWQNADGTLTEIFRRNDEQPEEQRDPVYRWCYKENLVANNPTVTIELDEGGTVELNEGWLTEETVEEKRRSVSAEMFRVEYDLGEPSIGNRAIDTARLDANFTLTKEMPGGAPIWEVHKKDWDEWRFEDVVANGVYAAAADWAKENDKTVIGVLRVDLPKPRLVYMARINRVAYTTMIGMFNREVAKYRVESVACWHDGTGLGNVVADLVDTRARAFQMSGDKRSNLLTSYVAALEQVKFDLPKVLSKLYSEHKYATVGDLYGSSSIQQYTKPGESTSSKKFHLPDTVCMMALAWHGAKRAHGGAAPIPVQSHAPTRAQRELSHPRESVPGVISEMTDFRIDLTV